MSKLLRVVGWWSAAAACMLTYCNHDTMGAVCLGTVSNLYGGLLAMHRLLCSGPCACRSTLHTGVCKSQLVNTAWFRIDTNSSMYHGSHTAVSG